MRTGHHCCQPVMDRFGIPSTTRASFAMYNTRADIDALVVSLRKLVATEMMKRPVGRCTNTGGWRAEISQAVGGHHPMRRRTN